MVFKSIFNTRDKFTVSCLNFKDDMSFGYFNGYKEAAKILSEYVINNNVGQDYLVYPIFFLYRHCVEIKIKDLILKLSNKNFEEIHSIKSLWLTLSVLIKKTKPYIFKLSEFNNIENNIDEIENIDKNSTSFRYQKNKKGDNNINIKRIDISEIKDVFSEIIGFLEYISCEFDRK